MPVYRKNYRERAKKNCIHLARDFLNLLDDKKTNLALAADVTTANELIQLADQLGPEICMLKTHIDIIEDFTPALTRTLQALAEKHHFYIFEDRKFADIGNTVKQQYANGIYRIADWAHFTNAHVLPGPGIIEGLKAAANNKSRGLILLAEMSSAGHLMNADYMQQTLHMAMQHADFVVGFITQHAIASANATWINFAPGIKLNPGIDQLKQQYVTPEQAILERGIDVIIVGRDIIHAKNPMNTARSYREAGWAAYQKRISG